MEFKNLINKFEQDAINDNNEKDNFKIVTDLTEAEEVFQNAKQKEYIAFYVLEDKYKKSSGKHEDFVGLSLCLSKDEVYIIVAEGLLTKAYLCDKLNELVKYTKLVTYDIKQQYSYINASTGSDFFDVLIGAYLCNP